MKRDPNARPKLFLAKAVANLCGDKDLLLPGLKDFKIACEYTLRDRAFHTGNHLVQFHCVVTTPMLPSRSRTQESHQ